ncbi:MAG: CCA tRNA nucleotidyltransferase [Roseobacter sp.]
MDRSVVITLPPDTDWLHDADAQAICAAVSSGGAQVFFVGGCVRDAILGLRGSDVDISTDATPTEVTELAQAAGFKVVPTGLDHGTVTVVGGGKGYEITTFRRDVATDGRHAEVAFSKDIVEDARRRDFTMNALYASAEGVVHDPLGGLQDCLDRRIRFIEDAAQRIQEDYLRILRYFRFHAWYAQPDSGFDSDALGAIAENSSGLETLSAERVGMEMMKLLSAPNPAQAVAAMRQTGCLLRLLPGSDDRFLGPVTHLEAQIDAAPDPLLRLASLGGEDVENQLRLSRVQARQLKLIQQNGFAGPSFPEVAYRYGFDVGRAAVILRAALAEKPVQQDDIDTIKAASIAQFPVKAADLMPGFHGKALGDKLADLEQEWILSGFVLSRDALLTGH